MEPKENVYSLKLKSREEVAEGTLEFRFDKPVGFDFKAGQFVDVTLLDPSETDAEGNTRAFSINSAPDDLELVFATRLRDTAFKRVLRTLPVGTEVGLEGPFGNLTLHNNVRRPAVLLAGGIGITPFRSIARWAAHQALAHRIVLFYSNRAPEHAAFLEELTSLAAENANFTLVATMTEMDGSSVSWEGETRFIDEVLLDKHTADLREDAPIWYLAGPPAMVADLRALLNGVGVDDDDIRAEEFGGY